MAEHEARFLGTHPHGLDDKGRMVLPAKIRAQLGETCVLAKLDGCLGLWTPEGFLEVAAVFEDAVEEAEPGAARDKAMGAYRRFVGDALEVSPDQQGRIVINQTLRDYAELGSEVITSGLIRRAEIWNRDRWLAKSDEENQAVAETISARSTTGRRIAR